MMSGRLLVLVTAAAAVASSKAAGPDGGGRNGRGHRRRLANDNFPPTRDASTFAPSLNLTDVPLFVLFSFNGAITPQAYDLYRPLSTYRSPRDGCPIKATWYTNVAQSSTGAPMTQCDIVSGLRAAGHEIATHTYGLTSDPTEEDIIGAVDWLNETCGVPREELRGFRTPELGFTQDTFDSLSKLGLLYDSSIADRELRSNGGRTHLWPYTMDNGIVQDCLQSAGMCDSSATNPGLWEIPLWRTYDEDDVPKIPVDWWGDGGWNVRETLQRNFERKHNVTAGGNRAPLAVNVKISWLATNLWNFNEWVTRTMDEHDDVFFITNYELIEWMRDPIPSSEYREKRLAECADLVTDCFIPPVALGGCGHGNFDASSCACKCPHPWGGENCLTKISDFWTPPPTPVPSTLAPTDFPTLSPTSASPTVTFAPTSSTKSPTAGPTVAPQTEVASASPWVFIPPGAGGTSRSGGASFGAKARSTAAAVIFSSLLASTLLSGLLELAAA